MAPHHNQRPHRTEAEGDLEAAAPHPHGAHHRPAHEHVHHGTPRREEELSSTAVVWDNELHEWRSQEEEVETRSVRSARTASRTRQWEEGGKGATPEEERMSEATVAAVTAASPEKMAPFERSPAQAEAVDSATISSSAAKEQEISEVVWLEWEKGDPENPFNVRFPPSDSVLALLSADRIFRPVVERSEEVADMSDRLHLYPGEYMASPVRCFGCPRSRHFLDQLVAYCGTAFASGTPSMMRDLNCSHELAVLGLSMCVSRL